MPLPPATLIENNLMPEICDEFNIDFTFYTDTPPSKDMDACSPTLRRYHKLLWNKELPNGQMLELVDTDRKSYLYHKSSLGEFSFSSDSITPSYRDYKKGGMPKLREQMPPEIVNTLYDRGSTIGAFIIFPSKRVNGQRTINCARGQATDKIADRFDITLECIRRHYEQLKSPLDDTLLRYNIFFSLFSDFRGYVDFFLLQDLVTSDYSNINFFIPHICGEGKALPQSKDDYIKYQKNSVHFIMARAARMQKLLSKT
jgi:hypothetical protein